MKYVLIPLLALSALVMSCSSSRHVMTSADARCDRSATNYCYNGVLLSESKNDLNSAYDLLTFIIENDSTFAPAYDKLFAYEMGLGADSVAVSMLDKAMANDPTNFWYGFKLANYYATQDSIAKAAAMYEDLLKKDPKRKELLYSLVSWYMKLEDYDKALSALDRLNVQTGETRENFITRMQIYSLKKNNQLAISDLLRKIAEEPGESMYKEYLAYLYMSEGHYADATAMYDTMLATSPYDADVNYSRLSALKLSDSTMFDAETRRILSDAEYPQELRMAVMLKLIIQDKSIAKNIPLVKRYFADALVGTPDDDVDMLGLQGAYYEMINDTLGALDAYNAIIARDPSNATANYSLLKFYLARNDVDGVMSVSSNAINYYPDELIFYFYLAIGYLDKDDYDSALQTCEKGVGYINSDSNKSLASQLYSIIGDVRHEQGDEVKAFAAYDKALELDADNTSVLNNYAYFLAVSGGDLLKAEEMISHALELTPDDPTMLDTYAWILFKQKDYALAKIYMDKTLMLDKQPSDEVLEHAGDIYFMCGEIDEAVGYWTQSRDKGNDSAVLKMKIEQRKYIEGK